LSVPIGGGQRGDYGARLHRQFHEVCWKLDAQQSRQPTPAGDASVDPDPHPQRVRGWRSESPSGTSAPLPAIGNPLVALLPEELPAPSSMAPQAGAEAASHRQRLASLNGVLRSQLAAGWNELGREPAGEEAALLAWSAARRQFRLADQLARETAWFAAEAPLLQDPSTGPAWHTPDPAWHLWRLECETLLAWHVRRTLEDFWGPWPGRDEPGFFADAGGRLVEAARAVRQPAHSIAGLPEATRGAWQCAPWEQRLAELRSAAPGALQMTLNPAAVELFAAEGADVEQTSSISVTGPVPAGTAAYFLRPHATLHVDEKAMKRWKCDVDPRVAQRQVAYRLARADLSDGQVTTEREAICLFRGHVYRQGFQSRQLRQDFEIVHVARPPAPARVLVEGRPPGVVEIVFVLDCSKSMDERTSQGRVRLAEAKEALLTIIDELAGSAAADTTYRVALRAFAHRSTWRSVGTRYELDGEIHPALDTEPVCGLDWLTQGQQRRLAEEVRRLRARGDTPLYYSILQAVQEDFSDDPDVVSRMLLVLTDGADYQSDVQAHPVPREALVSLDELWRAFDDGEQNGPPLTLEIVEFDIGNPPNFSRNPNVNAACLAAYERLFDRCRAPDDAWVMRHADDRERLIEELKEAVGLRSYLVRNSQEEVVLDTPTPLGRSVPIAAPLAGAYEVALADRDSQPGPRLPGSSLEVRGGELLALRFSEPTEARRLIHAHEHFGGGNHWPTRIDEPGIPCRTARPAGRDPHQEWWPDAFYVAVHLPEWDDDELVFRVSIQNDDPQRFSPRPAEIWIDIEPCGANKQPLAGEPGTPYRFCNFGERDYEPDLPVPVVACRAREWPSEAVHARLTVRWRMVPPELDGSERTVGSWVDDDEARGKLATIGGAAVRVGLRRSDGQTLLTVTESASPNSPDEGTSALQLEPLRIAPEVAPARTVRRSYAGGRYVEHEFWYARESLADVRAYVLRVLPRAEWLTDAEGSEEPLLVEVPDDRGG
jgi:hypothetical protein